MKWMSDDSRYARGYAWCSSEGVWVRKEDALLRKNRLYCPNCGERLRVKPHQPKSKQTHYRLSDPIMAKALRQIQLARQPWVRS